MDLSLKKCFWQEAEHAAAHHSGATCFQGSTRTLFPVFARGSCPPAAGTPARVCLFVLWKAPNRGLSAVLCGEKPESSARPARATGAITRHPTQVPVLADSEA